jgi:hypothetical protein
VTAPLTAGAEQSGIYAIAVSPARRVQMLRGGRIVELTEPGEPDEPDPILTKEFMERLVPMLRAEPILEIALKRAWKHIDEHGVDPRGILLFVKEIGPVIECTTGQYSLLPPERRVRLRFACRAVTERAEGWR